MPEKMIRDEMRKIIQLKVLGEYIPGCKCFRCRKDGGIDKTLAEIRRMLPKEKRIRTAHFYTINGFNDCVSEIDKAFGKEGGK